MDLAEAFESQSIAIHKGGDKDWHQGASWCPITMTNAIYRVIMRWAKSAALKRFEENLPESQVGSRAGR